MMIYELMHIHGSDERPVGVGHDGGACMIGFFSSRKLVDDTIQKYRTLPGFRDYPNNFFVFTHELSAETVFFAQLYVHDAVYEYEYVKGLGVFSTEQAAADAVAAFRCENTAASAELISELTIDRYQINVPEFPDGFDADLP